MVHMHVMSPVVKDIYHRRPSVERQQNNNNQLTLNSTGSVRTKVYIYIYMCSPPPPKIHCCSVSKPPLPNFQKINIFKFPKVQPQDSRFPNFPRSSPKALDFQISSPKALDYKIPRFPNFQISRFLAPRL